MEKEVRKLKDSPEKVRFWTLIENAAEEIRLWPSYKKDSTWLENHYSTSSSQVLKQSL